MSARVALVLVSHSAAAAEGTAEIARQMAPDVVVLPAGGADGGIGTSFDAVLAALEGGTEGGRGVVVLTDLGSAVLTSEAALEALDDPDLVRVPSAPFVEGAVAAAVEAQGGGDLDAVEMAAVRAASIFSVVPEEHAPPSGLPQPDGAVTATAVLRNPLGLHARPAAVLARTVADMDVRMTVNGVDAASVLELMKLGATGGQELTLVAAGPQAEEAVKTVVAMVEEGFGEA